MTHQQTVQALSQRIKTAIRAALPQAAGQSQQDQIDLWHGREQQLKTMYAAVENLRNSLLRGHARTAQRVPLGFRAPDVLRAELLADRDATALQRAVEAATATESEKLGDLITNTVCENLRAAEGFGTIEAFGNKVRRLTLWHRDGAKFECDLANVETNKGPQSPMAFGQRFARCFPDWLLSELEIHTGCCIRFTNEQQRLLPLPVEKLSVLTLGPFILGQSGNVVPRTPRASLKLPPLPNFRLVGAVGGVTGVLATLTIGIAMGLEVLTAFGGFGVLAAVFALLLEKNSRVQTP